MEEWLGRASLDSTRGAMSVTSQVSKIDDLCEFNEHEGEVAIFIVILVFEIESSLRENRRKLRARMEWSQGQDCLPGYNNISHDLYIIRHLI